MNDSETCTEAHLTDTTTESTREARPLFETGRVFIERRALDRFSLAAIDEALTDHVGCLTGPCSDWQYIDEICLRDGGPMFSLFRNESGDECYIITEPDRSKTTVMMRVNES